VGALGCDFTCFCSRKKVSRARPERWGEGGNKERGKR
jgi:hypothetical protein